jgi:lipoyl(octanoyl) transferase
MTAAVASKTCWVVDLGLISYSEACELQQRTVAARKQEFVPDVLFLCEHPHVITLGRNGQLAHLRASDRVLRQMGVEFHASNRGGDITYHGPGQIVGYPILNLAAIRRDVGWYVGQLEEAMIRASASLGVSAKRIAGLRGIWVETPAGEEKLAAIGVHLSRWVTSHGFAYNVATDLRYFDLIVPCGIAGRRATSLERVLGRAIRREEVAPKLASRLAEVLGRAMHPMARREFEQQLDQFVEHGTADSAMPALVAPSAAH